MRFFFYGTLLAGSGNPVADWLHPKLEPGRACQARGRLYAVADPQGWYPAFVPDPEGGAVRGMVHETAPGFTQADLARLDAYELHFPDAPHLSEFVRKRVAIRLSGETRERDALSYVWAGTSCENLQAIPGGDFPAFLAERGWRAFKMPAG